MNQNILNEYVIKETIGKGTFSKVKLGIIKSTGEKVAIKILEKRKIKNKTDQIRVERELNILKKINHINIVRIIQTKEDQNNIYIIMEFIDYDLFLHIVNNKRLDEKESSLYFFQLITGLEYIHFLNIVHRDLKPENLLLTKKRILKIIDFGLSNYFMGDELLLTPCGSPSYTPPEMIKGYKYNGFAVDIWSTGIILYGMLCGYLPFEERDNKALFKKIIKCKVNYPKYISNNAQNLLKKILVANPDKRITINEIKKHPFYLEGKEVFYKRFPDYIEKIENALINPINNKNNTNDTSPNDKNPNNNENGTTLETKMNYKYGYNKKEKSSSAYKSRKHNPNYYILKRILKGSRENFLEEENKNINTEKNESQKENEVDEEKVNLSEKDEDVNKEKESQENSQVQTIQKISNNEQKYHKRRIYKKRPIYTQQKEENMLYKQKYIKTNIDSLDYENEKNYDSKSSFNNFRINANSENDRNKEYEDRSKEEKNDSYIINGKNIRKYTKRNINYDYSFTKQYFNPGKSSTQHNTVVDEEKSITSLNNSLYKTNNYSYRLIDIKGYSKNNNSINNKYESKFGNFDCFYNNKNGSLQMKSYMLNNSKNESSIKREKRKNTDNKINSPSSQNYSGLSKKIISINHLYNLIQNKLDKRNNEQNDLKYQSSVQNLENTKLNMSSNIKENKKKNFKSEQHRKKKINKIIKNKNNNCNIKYSTSYLQKRLKSLKNSNNNSKVNVKDLNKCLPRKINIEPMNNNNSSISHKFKNTKKNIVTDLNKNLKISKNDKYNIKEIIKKRGLNKINIK